MPGAPYVPWRLVVWADGAGGVVALRLECGHVEAWPGCGYIPTATHCSTCDPPTFRGKPFIMPEGWPHA